MAGFGADENHVMKGNCFLRWMSWLLCIIALVALSFWLSCAEANTLIVIVRFDDGIILGADSEITNPEGTKHEKACKVNIANDYIWAIAGLVKADNESFNAADL
jgi:hypothetical protein